jgi:hypothetical protein
MNAKKMIVPERHPPVHAKVLSYDARRGTSSVVTLEERSRKLRIPWSVLAHAPVLAPGMEVVIIFAEDGEPKAVLVA